MVLLDLVTTWIKKLLRLYIILLLAALLGLTFVQVLARYLMQNPFTATDQLARIVLVWLTFMGAAVAILENKNVRIDTLERLLPKGVRHFLSVGFDIVLVGLLAVLTVKGYEVYQVGAFQTIVGTPFSYQAIFSALVAGVFLMGLFILIRLIKKLRFGYRVSIPTED